MSNVAIGFVACPVCQSKGQDTSGNNRVLYDDGGHFCFACGDFRTGSNKRKTETTEEYGSLPMFTTESVLGSRGISPEVVSQYGCTTLQNKSSGQLFIKFPFTDVNGEETNYQLRAVDTSTGRLLHEIKFSKGHIQLPLFGWKQVKANTKTIIVCEGITDTLVLASNYSRFDTVVVGLGSATSAKKAAAHILQYDNNYKIVLAFDNDAAGRQAEEDFIHYFEVHKEDKVIHKLSIPEEHKDISDWASVSSHSEFANSIENAQAVGLSGILDAGKIGDRVGAYLDSLSSVSQIELQFAPTLSRALRLMPGKLIGVIGASGEGKSTFVEHIAMEVLNQKLNCFVVSQEMLPEEFAVKLLRMVRNEPLDNPKFVQTLSSGLKLDIVKQTKRVAELLSMTDSFGEMSLDSIDRFLHKLTAVGKHPDVVIVDHLLAITNGGDADTILKVCGGLKALARKHETCIFILTHTSKPQNKGRGINQPTLNAAYGSSGIPIYCDAALGIASSKEECITMVETVKLERMGGTYANVTFEYSDYCLTEKVEGSKVDYDKEEDNVEEEDYY